MTIDIIKKVENILQNAGIQEYKQEAKLIVTEISKLNYEDIMLGKEIENEKEIMCIALKRAELKMPIQYILGFAYFMGEKYIVNEDVLIPRDETEILVNKSSELLKNKKGKINILDIGVGSGCISCALAKKMQNFDIEILGVDISINAIETALLNVDRLNLIRKVVLRKSDIFSKIRDNEKFDLIVSNPPYIPIKEKNKLQFELQFEPQNALFASDEKGIEFYEKIIEKADKFLKKNGFIAFELGINQAKDIQKLLKNKFKNIEMINDLAGIERVICAQIYS